MTWKTLLLCVTLVGARTLSAQSPAAAGDQVAGKWTGVLRPNDAPVRGGTPVEIEFRSDGGAISGGTVIGPQLTAGEIRRGSFDAATGVLTFEVVVPGAATPYVFEGTLLGGIAAGRVKSGGGDGAFAISRSGTAAAPPAADGAGQSAALRYGFDEVSGWVARAAELVPAERYGYRPVATVRSVAQQLAHIADSYNYFCARAAGRSVEWSDAIEKGALDKPTLLRRLGEATDACAQAHGTGGARELMANIAHTNLHYGNLITYLRMMGLAPPSS